LPGQVTAVGLNFADVFTVLGMYDAAPRGERVIPGLEFAGTIVAIGETTERPRKQVKLRGIMHHGCLAVVHAPAPFHSSQPRLPQVQRSADGKRYVVTESSATETEAREAPKFRVGDRVMGISRFGSFSTAVNVNAAYIRHIPNEWTFEQARRALSLPRGHRRRSEGGGKARAGC